MHDDGLANDRIFPAEAKFAFPIEVGFAGCVGLKVAEVAGVMIRRHRSAVMFLGRIKMGAG